MRQNHKGFSLIELIVVIAIVGIASVAIVGFMVTGTRSYAATSAEATLQREAQIAMNQIEDLVIDTTKAVTYGYQDTEGGTETLIVKDDATSSAAVAKRLCLYNDTQAYEVIWKQDKRLYYAEYAVVDGVKSSTATEYLLSDYVNEFRVDLSNLEEKRVVQVNLEFENQGKIYQSSNNITIRNQVIVNARDAYEDPTESDGTAVELRLQEDTLYLCPNDTYMLLPPLVTGTGHPSQTVTWAFDPIEKPADSDTTLDESTGSLQIGQRETVNSFKIIATTAAEPHLSKSMTVYIKRVNSVTVTDDTQADGSVRWKIGATASVKADVIAQNTNETDVTWRIMSGAAYVTQDAEDPTKFTIKEDTEEDSRIVIRATSVHSREHKYPDDTNFIYGEITIIAEKNDEIWGNHNLRVGQEINIGDMTYPNDTTGGDSPTIRRYVRVQRYLPTEDVAWADVSIDEYSDDNTLGGYWDSYANARWTSQGNGLYYLNGDNGNNHKFTPPYTLDLNYQYIFTYYTEKVYRNDRSKIYTSIKVMDKLPRLAVRYSGSGIEAGSKKVEKTYYTLDSNTGSATYLWEQANPFTLSQESGVILESSFGNSGMISYERRYVDGTWGSDYPYVSQSSKSPTIRLYNQNSRIREATYRFYPTVNFPISWIYDTESYERPDNYFQISINYGNITIADNECFVPYPSHPDFYGNAITGDEEIEIGNKTIRAYENTRRGKGNATETYFFRMNKQSDGTYRMKVFTAKSSWGGTQRQLGVYWCSETGTEWTKVDGEN